MKTFARIFLALPLLLLLTACASNSEVFKHYADESSVEGGPVMKIVSDVEIWKHGKPDKAYKVIGVAEDTRKSGLIFMAGIDTDIAKKVKEKGGDGAFRVAYGLVPAGRTPATLVMSSVNGTPYSYTNPSAVTYARSSKYEIFKYKD